MKTNLRFLALSAAILSMFTACQREELEQNQKPEALTHSVTFVAGAPETKTTVDVSDGATAKFAWTAEDVNRFTVYENGVPATKVLAKLGIDGKMSMTATFSGDVPASPKYQALYNSEVSATQNIVKDSYSEVSDVMVSNVLDGTRNDNFVFSFKREVAFAKMTLKGLTSGAYVSSVTIESDKPIAGQYDLETGTFVNTSNVITLDVLTDDVLTDVVDGNATVWFTTIPVEEAIFTITAKTTDDAETVAGTFTKTFTKAITLTRGDVKGFGVAMAELVDPHKNDNGWFLVKDAKFLAAGDVIRIGCASKSAVAGSLSADYLSGSTATYSDDMESMNSVSSSEDFTLGGSSDAWTLTSASGTLGATAVKKLTFDASATNYVGIWTIAIADNGDATISPNKNNFGRILCNAGSSNRFTTYTSDVQNNMLLPGIYKKYGTPAETKKDQTISFDPTSYTATIGKENTYPTLTAQSTGAKTWTSSNTEVATIDGTTGEITLVAAGTTTISVTVAGDDTYNAGTGSYELTVENAPIVSTETWSLVTDASSLALGDVIVIVAADANVAMSKTQTDNNRGQQTITKNADNTVTIDDNVQQLTLGAGKTTGTFSLSTGSGYLYAASSSKNYLRTYTTLDNNGYWTITIASKNATIKANGSYTHNWLRYNSSNSIFSCYESGQGDVQIYRKNDTRAVQTISYSAETGSIDKYTSVKNIPTLDVSGVKTTVSYTSSDATVATVSESGEITPLKAGTTTITAIAAASAEYREAKASFVLTVTDSSPYLRATASKTSVAATGETVTITVDTNVENWTAISDNAAFAVGTQSGNTVDVVVSENTDASERTATITVTAGTLSETITLTQVAAGAVSIIEFSKTYSYGDFTGWSLTEYTDKSSYYLIPSGNNPSVATISGIFTDKTIKSDVEITLNVATYGNGDNPSASTFSIYADSDCKKSVTATQSGTLPTSSTYKNVVYKVTKDDAAALISDLAVKITKPGKQIRLKSIQIKFRYSNDSHPAAAPGVKSPRQL